jgi:RimJ/RimL family protein N-acetyltransferase
MPVPDALVTERLIARPLTGADVDPWMEFMLGEGSLDFLPFVGPTREGAEWWIERQLGRYERDGHGLLALVTRSGGDLVGQAGLLTQEVEGRNELEVGYHLMPRFRGVGLATEAARAFIRRALETGMAESVVSIIHVDNAASQRVARRNGMDWERGIEAYGAPHRLYRTRPPLER